MKCSCVRLLSCNQWKKNTRCLLSCKGNLQRHNEIIQCEFSWAASMGKTFPFKIMNQNFIQELLWFSVITRSKMAQKGHGYFSADMTRSDSDQWKLQDIVLEGFCELIKSFLEWFTNLDCTKEHNEGKWENSGYTKHCRAFVKIIFWQSWVQSWGLWVSGILNTAKCVFALISNSSVTKINSFTFQVWFSFFFKTFLKCVFHWTSLHFVVRLVHPFTGEEGWIKTAFLSWK